MNLHAVPNFLAAILIVTTGLFATLRNRKSKVNFTFFLLTSSAFIWQIGTGLALLAKNPIAALLGTRIAFFGIALIPVISYHLSLYIYGVKSNKTLIFGYIGAFFFFIPLSWTPLILNGVYKYPWGFFFKAGPLHPIFMVFFIFFMVLVFSNLFLSYRKETNPLEKNRKKYFLVALFIAYIGSVDYLPTYGIQVYPFGYLALICFVLIFAYAIQRYNLMDVRIAITRATIFIVVYSVVLIVPFIFGLSVRNYMLSRIGIHWWLIPVFIMGLLASAGPFIYAYLQRETERRLRREEFLAHRALNRLAQNMMRFTNLVTLLGLIVHQVVKIMKVGSASAYLRDEGTNHYLLRATWSIDNTSPEQGEFLEDSPLIKDILLRRVPIISEELRFGQTSRISSHLKRVQSELQRANAAVVIPAFKGDNLFGFLILSPRRDNRMFTQEDLSLLMLLANQSVLATENARLFEKEKTFLAEKSRRDALADMAPGVAHQFNNRLISITVVAETQKLLLEQKETKKLDPELVSLIDETKNTLDLIVNDAMKGKDIANAILNKGRAKLTYEEMDLLPIIESSISLLKMSRTKESLKGTPEPEITITADKGLPKLILNESLMQDIFYNLIDNARDAIIIKHRQIDENKLTPDEFPYKGKVTVQARREASKIIVSIKDNGIGMKEKEKKRLFVPYFTTKATALKGTGLGLWTIRSFVEDHKGRISVESEYTKGTTFIIEFPIDATIKQK